MADGGFLTMEEARALFAGHPPRARVTSWARTGLDKGRIKLQVDRPGQKMLTRLEWVEEFRRKMEAYFAAGRKGANGHMPETPARAKKRRAKTGKRLDALGVKG
jgi:hypothetical protein